MFRQRLQFYRSLLVLADVIVIAGCWIASYFIRFNLPLIPVTKGVPPLDLYLWGLLLVEAIWIGTFYFVGLYRLRGQSRTQVLWSLIRAELIAFLLLIAATYFTHRQSFSRIVFIHFFVLSTLTLSLSRLWLKHLFVGSHRARLSLKALIVGADDLAQITAERLCLRPELGVEVIGFLAAKPARVGSTVCDLPVLGAYNDVDAVIAAQNVGLVLIALPLEHQPLLGDILNAMANEMVEVKVVPDLYRFVSLRTSVEEFDGLPIISLRESPMHGWNRVLKRSSDVILASGALLFTWPLMLLAAIGVKLSSPGPIFYRQQRMGLDGRIFNMAKFRTMYLDAEKSTGPTWARPNDPRRTPLGRFLRRFSIDELPQLFHVLKGEMSLVGPRPERPEFIATFKDRVPKYMLRHKMKAGMTGWAQIKGFRGQTSLEGRIEHDLDYIENWSLGFDLNILARTLWHVLADRNAY